MVNSTFENSLLEAEIAALKKELQTAKNKLAGKSSDHEFIAQLKQDVYELEDEAKTADIAKKELETTIKRLENTNKQLQDKQLTGDQRIKLNHYDYITAELRDIKNGALERENDELRKSNKGLVNVENETQRKCISQQTFIKTLQLKVKSLEGQLSSDGIRGTRNYWKNWCIAEGIVILFSFLVIGWLVWKTY